MIIVDRGLGNPAWHFAPSGGDAEGFNEGAIDIFQGQGLQSLVREVIQNSSDAQLDPSEPTEISFSVCEVSGEDAAPFTALAPWLKRAWESDPEKKDEDDDLALGRHTFYRDAISRLANPEKVPLLAIHDFNTHGLTGPTKYSKEPGSWWKLVRSTGSSLKNNPGAAGSFGHGSKAPFAFSGARTVFYYTAFGDGEQRVERFQGKSILEAMADPNHPDSFTSNTGYFGLAQSAGPQPLTNSAVPAWIREERARLSPLGGTSLVVVLPQFESAEEFWEQTKVAVTANFTPAVLQDRVVIHLGNGERIDSDTIRSVFERLDRSRLDDTAQARLESAHTALTGRTESRDIEGMGRIDFFSRTGESVKHRKVGIARTAGMLITREAEHLKAQFGSTEPFDLFVWVRNGDLNKLLRSLENPAHDAFEFDRIKNPANRKRAEKAYREFTKHVRGYIADTFGIKVEERMSLSDLDFLLSDESLGVDGPPDTEGADLPTISPIQRPVSPAAQARKKKKGAKAVAVPKGRKPPRGQSGALDGDGANVERNEIIAEGFRIVPHETDQARATLYFDPPPADYRYIEVYRTGETVIADQPCRLSPALPGAKPLSKVSLPDGERKRRIEIAVRFDDPADLNGGSRLLGVLR